MENLVRLLTHLGAELEIGASVIVGFAAGEAIVRAARGLLKWQVSAEATEEIRLRLARWLAFAIEFELGAEHHPLDGRADVK